MIIAIYILLISIFVVLIGIYNEVRIIRKGRLMTK